MELKFSHPMMFYLIWAVVLVAGVLVYGIRKRTRILLRYASEQVQQSIVPEYRKERYWIRGMLSMIGLVLIVIALCGPLWGFKWETVENKGVDIMICLDCSRSMLAQDIKPSRLERAKFEIIDLLRMMKSDRAGLVAFSGTAVLQCPLTLDRGAFTIFLDVLGPDYLPVGGTDLESAIRIALDGFEEKIDSDKAIIIITDGENTFGDPLEAAKIAAEKGVKIFCIGVGSQDGAPVPETDGGFKKDGSGRIVLSKVDDDMLKQITDMSKGIYVKSVAGDMDLDLIYEGEIQNKMEKKNLKSGRRKVWENRFQWFLLPGLLLLLVELAVPLKRNHSKIAVLLIMTASAGLFFPDAGNAGSSSSVKKGIEAFDNGQYEVAEKHFIDAQLDRPEMPELYYNIGTAAYKREDYESAVRNFKKALEADDQGLKKQAAYNLGNSHYRLGDLEAAVKDYETAIQLDPEDNQVKENLEFVKKKLEEEKKQQQNQKGQNQKNKDQDDSSENDQKNQDQNQKDQSGEDQKNQEQASQEKQEQNSPSDQNEAGESAGQQDQKQGESQDKQAKKENTGQEQAEKNSVPDQGQDESMAQQARQRDGQVSKDGQGPELQRLLNRLEDKPGKAMMPAYSKKQIEKDW